MPPLILSQPEAVTAKAGETATFNVKAAAVPEASYQWFKNDKPINGATNTSLTVENAGAKDAAVFSVAAMNASGTVKSRKATLKVR